MSQPIITPTTPQKQLSWIANYSDGTCLNQYEDGKENKYADINREKLSRFDMVDITTRRPVYALYIREDQRLIFRRRDLTGTNGLKVVIYLVGYQQNIMTAGGPKRIVVINYLHPDGSVALDGARDNLELLNFEL